MKVNSSFQTPEYLKKYKLEDVPNLKFKTFEEISVGDVFIYIKDVLQKLKEDEMFCDNLFLLNGEPVLYIQYIGEADEISEELVNVVSIELETSKTAVSSKPDYQMEDDCKIL